MNPKLMSGLIALTLTCVASATVVERWAPADSVQSEPTVQSLDSPNFEPTVPPTGTFSMQDPGDDIDWPPPGVPDDLDPIYFFATECPNDLVLVNWTDCILYFRTFLDCDGDGVADEMNEHFVMPYDHETKTPWVEHIKAKEDCDILWWGLFDIIPMGGCEPGWLQDPYFGCAVHFL